MDEKELYQLAMEAKNKGNTEESVRLFSEIIELYPNSSEAETARAIRYELRSEDNDRSSYSDPKNAEVIMDKNNVIVTDIRMPFMSMVVFMVKWAIASIPAIIILALLFSFVAGLMGGLGGYGY